MLTLKQFDDILSTISNIVFVCDKIIIESHFHVTEIAYIQKSFVDCGGTKRHEQYVSMQLWVASDIDHCLSSVKLRKIIEMAKDMISDFDIPLVIEYQGTTIGSYHVQRNGTVFFLKPIFTNCLAQDKCGISPDKISKDKCCGDKCC